MSLTPKKESLLKRFRDVLSDPNNSRIPRDPHAGEIRDGAVVMHNGLLVRLGGYYDRFSDILLMNRGVHEPQEEAVFAEVLTKIPAGGTMLELGSYWAFYSLWFFARIPGARCYMVEPHPERIKAGMHNFKLNRSTGDFVQAGIGGNNGITVDGFLKDKRIAALDILHSDIQGAELEMLRGAAESMRAGRIRYFFISTHSQDIHLSCLKLLEESGYEIIASADYEKQTFCYDGIIVAKHHSVNDGLGMMDIGDKSETRLVPYHTVIGKYAIKVMIPYAKYSALRIFGHD